MYNVHFLGIGGSGQSAAAAIAQAQGHKISGCDREPFNDYTKPLDQSLLFKGHSPDHLEGVDILAVTPTIFYLDPENPEIVTARKNGIKVMTWQHFMGRYLEKDKFVIAICGTSGKTTVTAMIGLMLEDAGLDPTVEVGAVVPPWRQNYRIGKGKYFVTESDEFYDNFLSTIPDIALVTSIEMDHPEYFEDFTAYKKSFRTFLKRTKKTIIANLSDKGVISASHIGSGGTKIVDYSSQLIDFPLQIPGKHNIFNASAAYQAGIALGIDPQVIKKSLMNFSGIGRRFELLGEFKGAKIYSDYGHHPAKVKAALEGAREKYPREEIILVFQPHMFSRTKVLFDDFVQVLQEAPVNKIHLLDIFPSREIDTGIVHSKDLVQAINSETVDYYESGNKLREDLREKIDKNQVIIFMGAGDIHNLAKQFLAFQ